MPASGVIGSFIESSVAGCPEGSEHTDNGPALSRFQRHDDTGERGVSGATRTEVLSLFTGAAAGWDLGLERTGLYRTVAACEIDPWRRAVYARNFPGVRLYDDVRGLTADRLRRDLGRLPSVVVGSPPCQDASAGNSRGLGVDGERTGLFFEAIRVVGECRPIWFGFENSPFLRTRGVDRLLSALEELDYAVWPLVVGAWHAGAPHRRDRVWLCGVRCDAHAEQVAKLARGQSYGGTIGAHHGTVADADRITLRVEPRRVGGSNGTDQTELEHALEAFRGFNGGFAFADDLDDGLPPGVAEGCLAAYGDAVIPQIPEAIGRVMARLVA